MMNTKGTRRMFLKMEPRRSLEKLGVIPMQRNCCMGYLVRWWIHPLRCALDYMRIVCPCKAWMGYLQVDGSIQASCLSIHGMNVLSSGEAWVHRSSRNHPLRHPPLASSSTYLTLLVLEECFWCGYFIICWYTLIVTLTYSEKGLCYCICNFIVRSLLS